MSSELKKIMLNNQTSDLPLSTIGPYIRLCDWLNLLIALIHATLIQFNVIIIASHLIFKQHAKQIWISLSVRFGI